MKVIAALMILSTAIAATIESTCNGHAELCERKYSNVTFIGAHDSAFIGNSPMTNQDWNVTSQLNHGTRLLQSQIHRKGSALQLCHTSCIIYDGGSVLDYLKEVKTWLDNNPREVLSMLFTNSESIDVETISKPFKDSGLLDMAYMPSSSKLSLEQWPRLGELIEQNQRVVIFMDYHADHSKVPAIIDEFDNIWEDQYNAVNASWTCEMDRGNDLSSMYIHNHFLDKKDSFLGTEYFTPDKDKLTTTNAATGEGSLGQAMVNCIDAHSRAPNFVLVDYESYGNNSVYKVAAEANSVAYNDRGDIHPPTAAEMGENNSSASTSKSITSITSITAGSFVFVILATLLT
ncbi:PLC-like phosphodiesterase [Wallemia mellicola]|uniref:PLC-like phosphodiesterase n=1 Tax=Wallemia mellicola TaxID=1708541 RepID=A0AB38N0Y0_9BASI|nr:PLC-like phosphodiesterase [Wallemia mellicola]